MEERIQNNFNSGDATTKLLLSSNPSKFTQRPFFIPIYKDSMSVVFRVPDKSNLQLVDYNEEWECKVEKEMRQKEEFTDREILYVYITPIKRVERIVTLDWGNCINTRTISGVKVINDSLDYVKTKTENKRFRHGEFIVRISTRVFESGIVKTTVLDITSKIQYIENVIDQIPSDIRARVTNKVREDLWNNVITVPFEYEEVVNNHFNAAMRLL